MTSESPRSLAAVVLAVFVVSLSLVLYELLLTRLFAVVLFAQFAHLALALALLGIGVGAIAQHLWPSLVPRHCVERRLGWLAMGLAVSVLVAVLATLYFPVLKAPDIPPSNYQERAGIREELLNPGWFMALLPFLALPFSWAGLIFAGVFQRYKKHIGRVYGADLIGGAAGALIFVPVLTSLAGPDTVFVITLLSSLGAWMAFRTARSRSGLALSTVAVVMSLGAVVAGRITGELLPVRQSAGFAEEKVSYVQWTPLTRLSVYDMYGKVRVLLDNSSASEVVLSKERLQRIKRHMTRTAVYQLHAPPGHVAILAASAGPEVAVAQSYGFSNIDAIDIASEIFELVATRYPDWSWNPYLQPGVRRVHADGRAAILRSREPYDIIQMVHANLWSSAGLLANAWSPSLLETKQAFATYLDHLTPDGTISFGRGAMTGYLVRAAAAALEDRGVTRPWEHIAYVQGSSTVMLLKARPWTQQERDQLFRITEASPGHQVVMDPVALPDSKGRKFLEKVPLLTDDRPYLDSANLFPKAVASLFSYASESESSALGLLYKSIVIQVLFVLMAGMLFVVVPWLWRGRSEMAGTRKTWGVLVYVAGLGYGYLAIETVLVHQLVLFVGHPTYAITVVVLSLLLSSGLGSLVSARLGEDRLVTKLRLVLLAVLVLGTVQTWLMPPILDATALGLPLGLRLFLTFLLLLPLGFAMGMPFPLAMRILPAHAGGVVPWAWAINGWMSVAASLATILASRAWGYSQAFALALAAYSISLALAGTLSWPVEKEAEVA